jgi:hypothetical protein
MMDDSVIDSRYLIRVKDYMPLVELPRPRRKENFIVNYGEVLPIILV